jgi:MFS family permease
MRLGLLRDHDYRLYWIGETVSTIGSAMAVVAMPLTAVFVLHAGAFEVGMLAATAWLPSLLIGLPAGAWVDRMRKRRPVMVTADLASFVLFASVPVAAWGGVLTIWQLVAVAFGGGLAMVFFSAANFPFLHSLVSRENLTEANAKMEAGFWAGELAAPGLAGLVAQLLGAATGVLVNAGSFLVSAFCLVRIRSTESALSLTDEPASASADEPTEPGSTPADEPTEKKPLRHDIAEGLSFIVHEPYVRVVALYMGAANFGECIMTAIVVVFLVKTVGVSAWVAGLLISVAGVGGFIGSLQAERVEQRLGGARGFLLSAAVTSPFMLIIPLTSRGLGLVLFAVGMFCWAIGIGVSNVLAQTFTMSYVPEHLLGRFSSTLDLAIRGTQPLGAVAGAVIGGVAGPRAAMWAAAAAITLSAAILFIGPIRKSRDFPAEYIADALPLSQQGSEAAGAVGDR